MILGILNCKCSMRYSSDSFSLVGALPFVFPFEQIN